MYVCIDATLREIVVANVVTIVVYIAFVCHHNSFLIFGSLKQQSLNRFAVVTHWSMGIAFFTCFALAVSGYLVFTDKTVGKYAFYKLVSSTP